MQFVWDTFVRLIAPLIPWAMGVTFILGIGPLLLGALNSEAVKDGLVWLVKRIDLLVNGRDHRA